MDDSDDYPIDEIVLDNQTLAVLDQEEQKYIQERSLLASANLTVQPINKRQKTLHGWAPGIGSVSLHGEIDDDLPEISLQGDGSYGIGIGVTSANRAPNVFPPPVGRNTQALRSRTSSNIRQTNPPPSGIYPQSSGPRPIVPRPFAPGNVPQRPGLLPPADRNRMEQVDPREQRSPALNELQSQMLDVQKKLNELRDEHSKVQLDLKNALEVKLAKEGEVSILRKNIEKTSQSHAAQLAQIKFEKEKAESKQAQMQKEMKEEVERLRTQYMFKQQELESAIRRPTVPASVRAKKMVREFPSTPLAIPSGMSSWNRGGSQNVALRGSFEETPMRPSRVVPVSKASPSRIRRSPEKTRKSAMLPGFENAFETSTPLRSQQVRILDNKGKGRIDDDSMVFGVGLGPNFSQSIPVLSQFQVPGQGKQDTEPNQADAIPPALPEQSQMNHEEMDVVGLAEGEDVDVLEPINLKAQLCRIILTHHHPSTKRITFQQLLSSSQFVNTTNHYSSSCARILEIIASSSRSDDYQESIEVVSGSLLSILVVVSESQDLLSMAILFDLLSELVLSLPGFQSSLLSSTMPLNNETASITIVDLLCKCVIDHLEPNKTPTHREEFASGLISLLDSLCFRLPSVALEKVDVIARNRNVFMILFHPSQPMQLIERASRLLVLLSTHHDFSKILLNQPGTHNVSGSDESVKDIFIERLCSHLIDPNRPQEAYKIHILVYFTQLSISHPDAHVVLITSYVLIPSLILYISHLTTPLWEDDGTLASSSSATTSLIRAINQSTLLLHHLIFRTDPSLNLRHKLQHAPHRPFNSISHIFIVTFGRLSYCEAPSWVEGEMRQELEYIAEISRDILELVVDGPEGDSVWAAFQTEPDEESTMDEEEMEAQLVGVDL